MTLTKSYVVAAFLVAIGLSPILEGTACAAEKESAKTVDWYMAPKNNNALHEKLAYCNSIRGEQGNTEDCNNARLAGRKLRKQSPIPKIQ